MGERAEAEGQAGSSLSRECDAGLNPRTWDRDLSPRHVFNQLGHPGTPLL